MENDCVKVCKETLESELLMMEGIQGIITLIRMAAESDKTDASVDIANACWALGSLVGDREDALRMARAGRLSGLLAKDGAA